MRKKKLLTVGASLMLSAGMMIVPTTTAFAVPTMSASEAMQQNQYITVSVPTTVLDTTAGEKSTTIRVMPTINMKSDGRTIKSIKIFAGGQEIGTGMSATYTPDVSQMTSTTGSQSVTIFATATLDDGTSVKSNIATLEVKYNVESEEQEVSSKSTISIINPTTGSVLDTTKGETSTNIMAMPGSSNTESINSIDIYVDGEKIGSGKSVKYTPDTTKFDNSGSKNVNIYAIATFADGTTARSNPVTLTVKYDAKEEETTEKPEVEKSSLSIVAPTSGSVLDTTKGETSTNIMSKATLATGAKVDKIEVYANGAMIGTGVMVKYTPDVSEFDGSGSKDVTIYAVATMEDGTKVRSNPITLTIKYDNSQTSQSEEPVVSSDLRLAVSGDTSTNTNTIGRRFTITNTGSSNVDLSQVKIRYYFTKDSSVSQNFTCDNAGMNLNMSPWYVNATSSVTGTITNVRGDLCYLEISMSSGISSLPAGQTINIETRLTNSDWSMFNQSNDPSYEGADSVVMLYNNKVVWGKVPN